MATAGKPLLSALLLLTAAACLDAALSDADTATVHTANGTVVGSVEEVDGRPVWQFLGIPFAEPPVGSLRFRHPQSIKEKWSQPLIATKPPNGCLQLSMPFTQHPPHLTVKYAEDCLYLNIWTPEVRPKRKRSVLIWIHGGAFYVGEGWPLYNGKALSSIGDVVVVVIQYRLGLLGFFRLDSDLVPGNMGLLDQQLALRWVHENIAQFGGDPDSVTLIGESAGGASVSYHMLSEESAKYFQRGIMQSGTANGIWACNPNTAGLEQMNRQVASDYLNCNQDSVADLLSCLQSKSEDEVLGAVDTFTAHREFLANYGPTVDGHFISKTPSELLRSGKIPKKDAIVGATSDEGDLFIKVIGAKYMFIKNITNPTDDDYTEDFVKWMINEHVPYYPFYPHRMSPIAKAVLHQFAISHVNPRRGDVNAKRTAAFIGQFLCFCPINALLDSVHSIYDNIYHYDFAHVPSHSQFLGDRLPWMGPTHADDIAFVFASPLLFPHLHKSLTEDEILLARRIIADFSSFARTGRPQDPNWRPYTNERKEYYQYGLFSRLKTGGVRRDECVVWDRVIPMLNSLSCQQESGGKCSLSPALSEEAKSRSSGRPVVDEL